MKDKFIRILSPITLAVVLFLDAAVIGYGIFAVKQVVRVRSTASIFFAAIEVIAIIVAILVTREILTNGIIFREDEFEISGLDDKNIFDYTNIAQSEVFKDDAPSFVKNFVDRHAMLTLTLKDGEVVSIDIGLCQKHTLEQLQKEICARCSIPYSPVQQRNKTGWFKKEQAPETPAPEDIKDDTEGTQDIQTDIDE